MMKYFVTGISGFLGPHLANVLVSEGHEVYGLVRDRKSLDIVASKVMPRESLEKITLLQGDLTVESSINDIFSKNFFDGVFHFAAQSNPRDSLDNPVLTHQVNFIGSVHLVEAIRRYQKDCKLVYASTSEVYGNVPAQNQPITEETPFNPVTPYGSSKASADIMIRERARSAGLNFVVGRGFASTGPGQLARFATPGQAEQIVKIVNGEREPVISVGNLKVKRTMMDIRDCAKAYYLLMQKGVSGEAYNVANPDCVMEIGEYLSMMLDIAGVNGRVELKPNPAFILSGASNIVLQIPSTEKIRKLGWAPKIPIRQTLKDLLDFYGLNK